MSRINHQPRVAIGNSPTFQEAILLPFKLRLPGSRVTSQLHMTPNGAQWIVKQRVFWIFKQSIFAAQVSERAVARKLMLSVNANA